MKASLNSLKSLLGDDFTSSGLNVATEQLLNLIGSKLGAIESTTSYGSKYDSIYLVKVVSLEKHPNADKLSLCLVDDNKASKDVTRNSDGLIQVVCGAPNVKQGMLTVWIPPGKVVPSTLLFDPLTLTPKDIRGQISNGMLASAKELDLSDDHGGIVEVIGDYSPGQEFSTTFNLKDDYILDLENKMFTHRPDCFGYLGLARELAGILDLKFTSPDWYQNNQLKNPAETEELKLSFSNELPSLVKRFSLACVKDVSVLPSPLWLQVELSKVGLRSINNIVDLTNYIMLITAQPLHAYDYDKVKSLSSDQASIEVRNPKPGEKITLLSGKTVEPLSATIMIATDKQLIGVAGVMGGQETEVDSSTKNIILECANFDMYSIRRTSMSLGLFTDAVTRFTKGQSPLQNLPVLNKCIEEIIKLAGGKIAASLIDNNNLESSLMQRNSLHPSIKITTDFINSRLGLELDKAKIAKLLTNVEFKVEDEEDNELIITAPYWRTDIELREDIVEEVGRLFGFDQIPQSLPKRDLTPASKNSVIEAKNLIRRSLSGYGCNEVLTYSFVHEDLLEKVGQDKGKAFSVANALSPNLQYYRLSLLPSLLEKVHPNIKAGYEEFALYEIGKSHSQEHWDKDGVPSEFEYTALVVTKSDKLNKNNNASPYFLAKKYLDTLSSAKFSYQKVSDELKSHSILTPFNLSRTALVYNQEDEMIGVVGEFRAAVAKSLKLPKFSAGFEIDTIKLGESLLSENYEPLSRYPSITQDLTLKVASDLSYSSLIDKIKSALDSTKPEHSTYNIKAIDIFQKQDKIDTKNVTIRIELSSYDRTLTDQEVSGLLEACVSLVNKTTPVETV